MNRLGIKLVVFWGGVALAGLLAWGMGWRIAGAGARIGLETRAGEPASSGHGAAGNAVDAAAPESVGRGNAVVAVEPGGPVRNAEEFRAFVEKLKSVGLSEEIARYHALGRAAESGYEASFQVAREVDALSLWAAGPGMRNPGKAVELLGGLDEKRSSGPMNQIFAELGVVAPREGLKLLLQGGSQPRGAVWTLFRSWGSRDPVAAATAALNCGDAQVAHMGLRGALDAATDLESIFAWASHQAPWVLNEAYELQYDEHGASDPEGLLDMLKRYPVRRNMWLEVALGESLALRGAKGWERIRQLDPGPFRDGLLMRYAGTLARTDAEAALQLAKELPEREAEGFLRAAQYGIAEQRPEELLAVIGEHPGRYDRVVGSAVEAWAKRAPAECVKWVVENGQGTRRFEWMTSAFKEWVASDPVAARAAFDALPPGDRARSLGEFASGWGGADPESAIAWAQTLRPTERRGALDEIASGWSATDPYGAAEGIVHLGAVDLDSAFGQVASNLVQKDPAYALDWIGRVSDPKARAIAVEPMVRTWANNDAEAASAYLTDLEPGGFRDRAVKGFVEGVARFDAESAARWAETVGDSTMRNSALRIAMYRWREQDRATALQYVNRIDDIKVRTGLVKILEEER